MSADAESTKATASKTTASASIAIAGRLLGKELHRLKLKWLDLQGADLRLGEKAYATGKVDGQSELSTKLDGVRQRITQLRERQGQTPSTFGGKVKAFATKVRKTLQIGALQLKRRRLLRRLGASLRQGGTNSSEEARSASAVADHITSVETAIADLRPQTYPWARRPLLITCLLLLLAAVGAFALRHKPTSVLAQQRGAAGRSSLSDEQMNKVVAQQQTFQQQMQQMVAEAHRREAEQTQARIAAAERQYREQRERERPEVEKRQGLAAAEQERVAAAERARQEAQKREEERRVAEEKARQEQQQREAGAQRAKERQEVAAREEQRKKEETAAAVLVAGLTARGLGAEAARGDPTGHVNKGVELTQKEQYDAAIAEFNAAIQVDPKSAEAYRGRAAANRALKKYNEAIADYSKSLQIKADAATYVKRGYIYVTYLQEYEKGITDYEQALKINPNDHDTQQRLQYARNLLAGRNPPPVPAAPIQTSAPAVRSGKDDIQSAATSNQPNPVDKKLHEAAEKFTVGRYAEAFKLHEEAISMEPDNPKGYLARGWAFFSTSQKDAALKDFDEALKRDPKEADGYFRRGVVHASGSEHEQAIADFTKAIECRPGYAEAYYGRGVSHTAIKKPDKAREDFDNVIRLDPKNVLAYLNRGRALLELHETDKALADYDRASELDSHSPGVFLGRGVAYLELRKYEAAQKDLEQAISLNREFVPAYLKLAELFSAEKKRALAALNLGRAYFYSEEYAKATTEFARAAELEPKLAAAHFELGRSKSAQAILEISAATATDKNPDKNVHQDAIIDAATSDIVSRLARPAVKSLEEAARLNPKDANIYLELGKAYFYWEPQSAIAAFEQAIKLEPKSAEAHFWLGVTKYTCGDQREVWKALSREQFRAQLALKDLNTAIALDPQHAGAYYFRADVNRTFERYQEAIDDLTAAIRRALPSQRYLEYGAIGYFPYKRMRDVTSIPDKLLAVSLKAAAYAQRGQCHSENRNEDTALADLDQAIRFFPTDPKLFHLRAVLQESPDAKLADLRRAAQLAGGNKYYTNMVEATLKQQAHSKELTFWEKAALGMGAVGLIAVGVGVKEPHDAAVREEELQKIITESRGTKMRCPERECNGTGRVLRMVFVWVPREYSWADPFPTDKTQEWRKHEEKCDRCDGKGWVWVDK